MRAWFALVALLAACVGTHFQWKDVEALQPGMSEQDVIARLGHPATAQTNGNADVLVWHYTNLVTERWTAVRLTFIDHKLVEVPREPVDPW